ncbi:DUF6247 family protein [Nonomuraea sp. NPDC050310]|uniref:DUF6247 family protein n=1 Tax=Nonomuraea sp. NPDC050310 TaxID=3154935 RepID=UPI0033EFEA38
MSAQQHEESSPQIEQTFTAVRAALPAENQAAFDAELEAITHADVVDLAALDAFLRGWWRIAISAQDQHGWEAMHAAAADIRAGRRPAGRALEEVIARRGRRS